MKFLTILSLLVFGFQLHAATYTNVLCLAQGTSVGGNDMGPFTADARLSLTIIESDEGILSMTGEGFILVAQAFEEVDSPLTLTPNNSYMGFFDFPETEEDVYYSPIKYKGYAQIEDFDANMTIGNESGMWGHFVFEKSYLEKDNFRAAYIFQAGDHLGGTLHFSCSQAL